MKILFASGNKGKLREVRFVAKEYGIEVLSPQQLVDNGHGTPPIPDPEETEADYQGNAALKARAFLEWSGMLSLADDSGLEVEALDGAPGVFSARYAGEGCSFEDNIQKLLFQLQDKEMRKATFYCTLCLLFPNGEFLCETGSLSGTIARSPQGDGGFGYDPIFLAENTGYSLAQLKSMDPLTETHRIRALNLLFPKLLQRSENPLV